MKNRRELLGWSLFLLSAVSYLAVGVRDRDLLISLGSIAFLVACLLFLWPYRRP